MFVDTPATVISLAAKSHDRVQRLEKEVYKHNEMLVNSLLSVYDIFSINVSLIWSLEPFGKPVFKGDDEDNIDLFIQLSACVRRGGILFFILHRTDRVTQTERGEIKYVSFIFTRTVDVKFFPLYKGERAWRCLV